jgi:hypothetical protein
MASVMLGSSLAGSARSSSNKQIHDVISHEGCGRATGYAEANKIVSIKNKTHVAWLDSTREGFRVRIKTFNRKHQKWSSTFTVGEAYDNHGGPALTCDSQGYLHIAYYPHHHPMRYRQSTYPNDASQWDPEVQFGELATYPSLICGPDDVLYCTFRRQRKNKPWQVEMWIKKPGKKWEMQSTILTSSYPGYAHFQESLAWSLKDNSLHLSCRIHEKSDGKAYGRIQTVGYMKSSNFGQTWQRSDRSSIHLPASAEQLDQVATGGVEVGRILRAGAIGLNKGGIPYLIYSEQMHEKGRSFLATPSPEGLWHKKELTSILSGKWKGWSMIMPGGLTYNDKGQLLITVQIQKIEPTDKSWGHKSNEVILLKSKDNGHRFTSRLISSSHPEIPNWLPSIERYTGHHFIPDRPGIIYTAGSPGEGNKDQLQNKVYASL